MISPSASLPRPTTAKPSLRSSGRGSGCPEARAGAARTARLGRSWAWPTPPRPPAATRRRRRRTSCGHRSWKLWNRPSPWPRPSCLRDHNRTPADAQKAASVFYWGAQAGSEPMTDISRTPRSRSTTASPMRAWTAASSWPSSPASPAAPPPRALALSQHRLPAPPRRWSRPTIRASATSELEWEPRPGRAYRGYNAAPAGGAGNLPRGARHPRESRPQRPYSRRRAAARAGRLFGASRPIS